VAHSAKSTLMAVHSYSTLTAQLAPRPCMSVQLDGPRLARLSTLYRTPVGHPGSGDRVPRSQPIPSEQTVTPSSLAGAAVALGVSSESVDASLSWRGYRARPSSCFLAGSDSTAHGGGPSGVAPRRVGIRRDPSLGTPRRDRLLHRGSRQCPRVANSGPWRTRFRADGGQRSGVMADSIPI